MWKTLFNTIELQASCGCYPVAINKFTSCSCRCCHLLAAKASRFTSACVHLLATHFQSRGFGTHIRAPHTPRAKRAGILFLSFTAPVFMRRAEGPRAQRAGLLNTQKQKSRFNSLKRLAFSYSLCDNKQEYTRKHKTRFLVTFFSLQIMPLFRSERGLFHISHVKGSLKSFWSTNTQNQPVFIQ